MFKKAIILLLVVFASSSNAGLLCYAYSYAPNLVHAVQEKLSKKGLYYGPVDGKWGPKTKEAVQRFQQKNKIYIQQHQGYTMDSDEGELEEKTLKALFGENAPAGVTRVRNPHHVPEDIWSEGCR
jgi:basic membrane lipoprotein Med (substrate-binding protein (PBP1-ABC) superfamily)